MGSLQVEGGKLKGATISGGDSAALIDEIPVLAAIAPFTEQGIEVRDAKELRVKESDRIAAVATNLRKMGAQVEEFEDGLKIPGGQSLHGAELDSFDDHRIAMAFAVAATESFRRNCYLGRGIGGDLLSCLFSDSGGSHRTVKSWFEDENLSTQGAQRRTG